MSTSLLPSGRTRMIDDFEKQEVRSSGELWSEICSSLPEVQTEATPESSTDFKDSFHPPVQVNGQANGTDTSPSSAKWEPMEDSEIYIATLGISFFKSFSRLQTSCHVSSLSVSKRHGNDKMLNSRKMKPDSFLQHSRLEFPIYSPCFCSG